MFDLDKWKEIYNTLSKNKLRTFLTAFGVGWGIFMLIIMLGAGNGLKNGVDKRFSSYASNSVWVWTQRTSLPYKGFDKGRRFDIENSDVDAIIQNIPEAAVVCPRGKIGGYRGGNNVTHNSKTGAFSTMGDYPDIQKITLFQTIKGRFINELDLQRERKVCAVGTRVVDLLFDKEENPIGEYITIQGVNFQVVGVFKSANDGEEAERDLNTIIVPFSTFQKSFNKMNKVDWMGLIAAKGVNGDDLEAKVKDLLSQRHTVHPEDRSAFGSSNRRKEYEKMMNLFIAIRYVTWFVGILTLIAGVIGISNILLIIVKERTKEIGVRRAIGATPINIISQVMMESIILTSLAGYLGLVLGVILVDFGGQLIDTDTFVHPSVDINSVLIALTVLVVAGACAGLLPASRAVRIKPVEALRDE